jgi:hypothetical protein
MMKKMEPFFVYYLDTSLKTVMLEEKNLSRKKSQREEGGIKSSIHIYYNSLRLTPTFHRI